MTTTALGGLAESRVATQLHLNGYQILDRNWRTKFCEIDIVAVKGTVIHFIEVKYRSSLGAGDGFAQITTQKLIRMQRAAGAWVARHGWRGPYRLSVASVTGKTAEHIELVEL